MQRECKKCNKKIPYKAWVLGKKRNLQRRKFCLDCSPFGSGNTSKYGKSCPLKRRNLRTKNARKYQRKRRLERKRKLVILHGGECIRCGYDKCLASLEFHHRDPKEKLFSISEAGLQKKWEEIVDEAKKCDLLCKNCHGEDHNQELINWKDADFSLFQYSGLAEKD